MSEASATFDRPSPAGFTLQKASIPEDLPAMMQVYHLAFKDEALYKSTAGSVDESLIMPYLLEFVAPRWTTPDITVWKIIKDKTSEMVAWAALQYPWSTIPEMTNEIIEAIKSPSMPTSFPEGTNIEALIESGRMLAESNVKFGFDSYHDFQRAATAVVPEYQKQGLGSYLAQHINHVVACYPRARADEPNKTYVAMRPASVKMFTRYGFKEVGIWDSHVERWGFANEEGITRVAIRVEDE